ncbi:hypothetical protein VroAM7_32290 [Vibrio rotiferianus]|uniref:Uncharacterized protein n=1 Tax=Vibrio rotiferianus TaxID=190895 RepID=A0A510IDU3_9VIBR|nr:hypothetical protein VroAM7_32290 [Vibrio rotiferianus]
MENNHEYAAKLAEASATLITFALFSAFIPSDTRPIKLKRFSAGGASTGT